MKSENKPLVSIITLNWNQTAVTCEFLVSTKKLNYPHYEILVCDMNSDESPAEKIQLLNIPNTRVLLSEKNLGFAAGNNWGMKHAKGDYFFIVNNDTEVTPDLLDKLLDPFQRFPNVGVTCPKIRYFHQPDTIQYAGFARMHPITGRTTTIGDHEKDHGQHDVSGPTFGAHGCAMMVKRSVAEKTGMFPERFFLYYEEWDWSCRIRKSGYTIYYTADALIYHKESVTVGRNSPLKTYYLHRNRILFMRRNSNYAQLILFALFYSFFTFPKNIIQFSLQKEWTLLKAYVKGVYWNLNHSSKSKV
ncbi:MAG TPA: glycosyltransferase family 2 protein [Ferruginibacter sp.]|nr:glycosyltransferase family 2 protein [Ferruginibacter sp.]